MVAATQVRCTAAGLLALLVLVLGERGAAAGSVSCEPDLNWVLPNGIEVSLVADASLPGAAVVLAVDAGKRDDPLGYAGLAHFVEHLTARARPPFASASDLYTEAGAWLVDSSVSRDRTVYRAVFPAAQLERALWIESRRLAVGLDLLGESDAAAERAALLREHDAEQVEPFRTAEQVVRQALFGAGHPYAASDATPESLERLTLEDARRFFAAYYGPGHARLAVVGGFDVEHAKRLVLRYFGALKGTSGNGATSRLSANSSCTNPFVGQARPARFAARTRRVNEMLMLRWPVLTAENVEESDSLFRVLTRRLSEALLESQIGDISRFGLVQLELGSYWALDIDVIPGKPFLMVERVFKSILKELVESPPEQASLTALQQSRELSRHLDEEYALFRAGSLVQRCEPRACKAAGAPLTPAAFGKIHRFSIAQAVILESQHDVNAPDQGSVVPQ